MAKKVVATFKAQGDTKSITKVIRMVKSQKTGSYEFREDFVVNEKVKDFLAEAKK